MLRKIGRATFIVLNTLFYKVLVQQDCVQTKSIHQSALKVNDEPKYET